MTHCGCSPEAILGCGELEHEDVGTLEIVVDNLVLVEVRQTRCNLTRQEREKGEGGAHFKGLQKSLPWADALRHWADALRHWVVYNPHSTAYHMLYH